MGADNTIQDVSQGSPLSPEEFEFFRRLIHEKAGIKLSQAKASMVQSRLRSRLRELGLRDFGAYRALLAGLADHHPEWQDFINVLTTNKTSFFREGPHYAHLRDRQIPDWLEKSEDRVFKVWSAACSTGQEPYSVSMWLARHLPADRTYRVVATDIDTEVLRRAQNAVYPRECLDELPVEVRDDGFNFGSAEISGWVRLRARYREKVSFQTHNLMDPDAPVDERFDALFCSNVLIYFAPAEVEFVVNKLYRSAKEGAVLYIGQSESLINVNTPWKCIRPSVYRKGSR